MPEGADHHQGPKAVARGAPQILVRDAGGRRLGFDSLAVRRLGVGSRRLGPRLDLVADRGFGKAPVAVERGRHLAIGENRPVRPLPGGALGALHDIVAAVVETVEEGPPLWIDAAGIGLVPGLELLEVAGVDARQETRSEERFVVPL